MRLLLGFFFLAVLIYWHYKFAVLDSFKKYYFPVLIIKMSAGIGVGLIYLFYYKGGDTWTYFNQAILFKQVAFSSWVNFKGLFLFGNYELVPEFAFFNQPRAVFMVKLVAIVNLITNDNYWLTSAFFSFFSFLGIWRFATWAYQFFNLNKIALFALVLWPSFLFWSSGVLKESVAAGLIFWIIVEFFNLFENKKSIIRVLGFILALYVLFLIKYYFAVVLIVTLIVFGIMKLIHVAHWKKRKQLLVWSLILLIGLVIGGFLHPNLELNNIVSVIIINHDAFVGLSNTNNLIHFYPASSEWVWLLINTPKALLAGLFLPLTFTSQNLFYSIASIENWVLMVLVLRGVWNTKMKDIQSEFLLILVSITYIGLLAIFLSLSTPNLGTLARYKVAYIPAFLVIIFILNGFTRQQERKL